MISNTIYLRKETVEKLIKEFSNLKDSDYEEGLISITEECYSDGTEIIKFNNGYNIIDTFNRR